MKLGGIELPDLTALPALSLPRLPLAAFRRRIVFHAVFVLLAIATLALAITLLAEEKRRSRQVYEAGLGRTLATLVARLQHPSGQLALLNAPVGGGRGIGVGVTSTNGPGSLAPLVLPFSALDFDDPFKARQAVEMSGCAVRWPDGSQLCAAVGNSAYAGGFVYLVAGLVAPPALARERAELDLSGVHRARITVRHRGNDEAWTAAFEAAGDAPVQRASGGLRGRLAGFAGADDHLDTRARPERDFRGWLWQDAECALPDAGTDCPRRTLLSLRVPVAALRDAATQRPSPRWPPADLAQMGLRLQWLGPDGAVVFDSTAAGASAPFALQDLADELAPGETLRISRDLQSGGAATAEPIVVRGREPAPEPASPWLTRLILSLPSWPGSDGRAAGDTVAAEDRVLAAGTRWRVALEGDLKSIDRRLGATATRLSWFVAAMLAAIGLAWLVIEVGLVRRIAVLTQRAAALSYNMQDPQLERRLSNLDVADLRGRDELGILAGSLAQLLERVKDGVRREHIRAEQERDMWHAVGHEIVSPLQSLMVLHGDTSDPSRRYVERMQQAVKVLYGSASPSEAIASASVDLAPLDLNAFLLHVAANAGFAGIDGVRYAAAADAPVIVRADEYALEDVVTHVLRNADRHRKAGSPIELNLAMSGDTLVEIGIGNEGAPIDPALIDRIFEYGTSGDAASDGARRGQGLFVARTYMAKMGGTIEVLNVDGGVRFVLKLPRAA